MPAAAVERAGDERALRVAARLLLADAPLVDERLHERVVVGDLRQDAVAQQVGARVADVEHAEPAAGEQERRQRGAHAVERLVARHHVAQVVVGRHGPVAQDVEQVAARGVLVERGDRGDRDRGGHLAGGVAAHAVGDGEDAGTRVDGVLVALAQQARVGAGGVAQCQGHRRSSRTVLPMRIGWPRGTGVGRTTLAAPR